MLTWMKILKQKMNIYRCFIKFIYFLDVNNLLKDAILIGIKVKVILGYTLKIIQIFHFKPCNFDIYLTSIFYIIV